MVTTQDPGVGQSPFTPVSIWAMLRALINSNTPILTNPGPPTNGTSGSYVGQAGPGALLIDFVTPNLYINNGTILNVNWSREISSLSGGVVQYLPFVQTGLFAELFNESVPAIGNSQNSAFPVTGAIVRVTSNTGVTGAGITLPPAVGGLDLMIINHSGGQIQIYGNPTSGDTINDIAGGTGITQMQDSFLILASTKLPNQPGGWYTADQATGFSRLTGLLTQSFSPLVTALGSNQFTATQLTTMFNRVTNVSPGTGVAMPAATPGEFVTIDNRGVNPLQVYGINFNPLTSAGDIINGAPAATGITVGVNTITTFYCSILGNWETGFAGSAPDAITVLNLNGPINPHTPHTYDINKSGVYSGTLAAPTPVIDDGIRLKFTSTTPFAHTIVTPGLLNTGTSAINAITFSVFAGGSVDLMARNGRWQVTDQNACLFS